MTVENQSEIRHCRFAAPAHPPQPVVRCHTIGRWKPSDCHAAVTVTQTRPARPATPDQSQPPPATAIAHHESAALPDSSRQHSLQPATTDHQHPAPLHAAVSDNAEPVTDFAPASSESRQPAAAAWRWYQSPLPRNDEWQTARHHFHESPGRCAARAAAPARILPALNVPVAPAADTPPAMGSTTAAAPERPATLSRNPAGRPTNDAPETHSPPDPHVPQAPQSEAD